MLQPATAMEELQGHNVVLTRANEGPRLDIGDWFSSWKAQGIDTGYSFAIFETELQPRTGLPLHKHPYPEFFYVLEGSIAFGKWNEAGSLEWLQCMTGDSLLAPANAPHAFLNKSEKPSRMLGISTYHHERMLKDAVEPNGDVNYLPTRLSQDEFEKLFKSMEANQVYVVADHA